LFLLNVIFYFMELTHSIRIMIYEDYKSYKIYSPKYISKIL